MFIRTGFYQNIGEVDKKMLKGLEKTALIFPMQHEYFTYRDRKLFSYNPLRFTPFS